MNQILNHVHPSVELEIDNKGTNDSIG